MSNRHIPFARVVHFPESFGICKFDLTKWVLDVDWIVTATNRDPTDFVIIAISPIEHIANEVGAPNASYGLNGSSHRQKVRLDAGLALKLLLAR